VTEHAYCARSCAVVLLCTLGEDAVKQIKILFHMFLLYFFRHVMPMLFFGIFSIGKDKLSP
jgi:hypothetical protein